MASQNFSVKTYNFTGVDIQSATINDSGQVEGTGIEINNQAPISFSEKNGVFVNQGSTFCVQGGPVRINDQGTITSYDGIDNVQTKSTTHVMGPNNEQITINGESDNGQYVGFYLGKPVIDNNGIMTYLNVPGSSGIVPGAEPQGQAATSPYAVNNIGQAIGIYQDKLGEHGFLYSKGWYTTLTIPQATYVDPTGINDLSEIVGYYKDASGKDHGFIDINGIIQTYNVPGATQTIISGINNHGQIIGMYDDHSNKQHMFVASPTHG